MRNDKPVIFALEDNDGAMSILESTIEIISDDLEVKFVRARTLSEAFKLFSEHALVIDIAIIDDSVPLDVDGRTEALAGLEFLKSATFQSSNIESILFGDDVRDLHERQAAGFTHILAKSKGIEELRPVLESALKNVSNKMELFKEVKALHQTHFKDLLEFWKNSREDLPKKESDLLMSFTGALRKAGFPRKLDLQSWQDTLGDLSKANEAIENSKQVYKTLSEKSPSDEAMKGKLDFLEALESKKICSNIASLASDVLAHEQKTGMLKTQKGIGR